MKFLIVTSAPTLKEEGIFCAYAPYVREMDVWTNYANEFKIASPNQYSQKLLTLPFKKQPLFVAIPSLQFNTVRYFLISCLKIPIVFFKLYKAMLWADHIHLRCPGNIGLLGCVVQVFFPKKTKTAKYAGNWDPAAVQPQNYKFQKWLLSNTFLTKRMTALVYGDWKNQTINIKSFFTATYTNDDRELVKDRVYSGDLKFVFVGSLVEGKRPLLAIQIVETLNKLGRNIVLDVYGEGLLKTELQKYIFDNNLDVKVRLLGNRKQAEIKEALKGTHFLILPSKSEGWPKAVAEAMFFGTIPIVTPISCVPFMLNYGNRGILIEPNLEMAVSKVDEYLKDSKRLKSISANAIEWSQAYTLDTFETEIVKLLKP